MMNLEKCKAVAIDYLNVTPVPVKAIPMFVYHPVFESCLTYCESMQFVDIMTADGFEKAVASYAQFIENANGADELIVLFRKPYRLTILHAMLLSNALSRREYARLIREFYQSVEIPSSGCTPKEVLDLFLCAKSDFTAICLESDEFAALPDEITVYRGVNEDNKSKSLHHGVSWTLDLKTASFFAERYKRDKGAVFEATINKRDIFMYYPDYESETVLDYRKLKNCKRVEVLKKDA